MSKSKKPRLPKAWLEEAERKWLEADNPIHLHATLEDVKVSARRTRLAAVAGLRACSRRLTLTQEEAADAAEAFADGAIGIDALKAAGAAVKPGKDAFALRVAQLCHRQAFMALGGAAGALPTEYDCGHQFENRGDAERCRPVMAVFRDVFGNPFRPVAFPKSWRTSTAVSLARQMYEWREFSAMPILADALQDAGCDSDDILDHCRGPGPHVCGCWVVDLVLGKE